MKKRPARYTEKIWIPDTIESLQAELAKEKKKSALHRTQAKNLAKQRDQLQESLEVASFRLDFCYTTIRLLRKDYPRGFGAAWTLADRVLMESTLTK